MGLTGFILVNQSSPNLTKWPSWKHKCCKCSVTLTQQPTTPTMPVSHLMSDNVVTLKQRCLSSSNPKTHVCLLYSFPMTQNFFSHPTPELCGTLEHQALSHECHRESKLIFLTGLNSLTVPRAHCSAASVEVVWGAQCAVGLGEEIQQRSPR